MTYLGGGRAPSGVGAVKYVTEEANADDIDRGLPDRRSHKRLEVKFFISVKCFCEIRPENPEKYRN